MVEELLAYQEEDSKLKTIENTLSASEDRKKAVLAQKYIKGVEENINRLDDRAGRLVQEFAAVEEQLELLKKQENVFAESKDGMEDSAEATYILKKIDETAAQIKQLAKKAESLAEEIRNTTSEYQRIKKETRNMQAQLSESGKKYNELKESFAQEKKQIEERLAQLAQKVQPELMEKYLKKRASKMYPVLYEVRGQFCGACNMELPMSELGKLKNGQVIECDQCGKLLYQKQSGK